eukprot:COSAG05_NODE_2204_length_3399_cov_4.885593_2_plen_112_part_00
MCYWGCVDETPKIPVEKKRAVPHTFLHGWGVKNARCIRILLGMLDLPWHAAEWPASGCLGLALACLLGRRALTSLDAKTGRAHASPVPVRAQNAAPIADSYSCRILDLISS